VLERSTQVAFQKTYLWSQEIQASHTAHKGRDGKAEIRNRLQKFFLHNIISSVSLSE
jgi:hypothetical protein